MNHTVDQTLFLILILFASHFVFVIAISCVIVVVPMCVCGGGLYLQQSSAWQAHCPAPDDTQVNMEQCCDDTNRRSERKELWEHLASVLLCTEIPNVGCPGWDPVPLWLEVSNSLAELLHEPSCWDTVKGTLKDRSLHNAFGHKLNKYDQEKSLVLLVCHS
jgi:hypothetical protein